MAARERYISVDIEASGPVPGFYSMLSLGACVVGRTKEQFEVMLKPVNDGVLDAAMEVVGKPLEVFKREGVDVVSGIRDFAAWTKKAAGQEKPVFVGFNAAFDWSFVNWYFVHCKVENPFGVGAIDIKSFYMGFKGCAWEDTRSSRLPKRYKAGGRHTHDALADAIEQANIFERIATDAGLAIA